MNSPRDFLEFSNLKDTDRESTTPPALAIHQTRTRVYEALASESRMLWIKALALHLFSGALTLLVCPQFGMGPLYGEHGLMGVFMQLGPIGCALSCGAFFMLGGVLLAPLIFQRGELVQLFAHRVWMYLAATLMSVALLVSTSLVRQSFDIDFTYILFWSLGAWMFSVVTSRMTLYTKVYE
jgi:hypothetical protein